MAQTTAKASTLTSTLTGHDAHDDELFISRPSWLINKPVETGVLPWNLARQPQAVGDWTDDEELSRQGSSSGLSHEGRSTQDASCVAKTAIAAIPR